MAQFSTFVLLIAVNNLRYSGQFSPSVL